MSLLAGEARAVSVSAGETRTVSRTEAVMALADIADKEQDRIGRCKLLRNEDQAKFKHRLRAKCFKSFLDRPTHRVLGGIVKQFARKKHLNSKLKSHGGR